MHKIAMISAPETRLPEYCVNKIKTFADFRCKRCENIDELVEFASDCDILWMFGPNIVLKPEALDQLSNCKALFRSGSGLDALPLEYAKQHSLRVYNTPDSIQECVAEHAVSLLFAMIRQIPQYDRKTKRGYPWGKVEGMNWHITGRTLGLIGYGNVARHVEEMVKGFHMNVIHYDPFTNDSIPLDDVLKLSDYVSLHCPLTPETRGLMNMEKFKLMKRNAILVNTSRGLVINEDDLVAALQNGVIAGAAIDVMVDEPPSDYHPLLKMENVIITPHIAAFSADFEKNFWEFSVRKLELICEDLDK